MIRVATRSAQHRTAKETDRKCDRCERMRPEHEFTPRGKICFECKEASKQATRERRAKRDKYAGYTPALKRAVYKYRDDTRQDYLDYQREYKERRN